MEAIKDGENIKEKNEIPEPKDRGRNKSFTVKDMQLAIEFVKSGKSIREAARLSNVPYATVRRRWLRLKGGPITGLGMLTKPFRAQSPSTAKLKSILKKTAEVSDSTSERLTPVPRKESPSLFTENQEIALASLFNGKNGNECRRIAYEMASEWNIPIDRSWVIEEMADKEWMFNFRKRLPDLLEKQYKNTQEELAKEGTSTYFENASSQNFPGISSKNFLRSPRFDQSVSSDLDSFGNDSSNSNHDLDIVKLELNDYESGKKRGNSSWNKSNNNNYLENKIKRTMLNNASRMSIDDVKIFQSERNQNEHPEKVNYLMHPYERGREKSESKRQDDNYSISGRSTSNFNHRSIYRPDIIDENTSASVQIINEDDNTDDSDETLFSKRSKKNKNDVVQFGKKDFTKLLRGITSMSKQNMDADELFLLSLLPALKRIAEKDKLKAKIKLLEVFDKFEE